MGRTFDLVVQRIEIYVKTNNANGIQYPFIFALVYFRVNIVMTVGELIIICYII